jgi:hypothetical protein
MLIKISFNKNDHYAKFFNRKISGYEILKKFSDFIRREGFDHIKYNEATDTNKEETEIWIVPNEKEIKKNA